MNLKSLECAGMVRAAEGKACRSLFSLKLYFGVRQTLSAPVRLFLPILHWISLVRRAASISFSGYLLSFGLRLRSFSSGASMLRSAPAHLHQLADLTGLLRLKSRLWCGVARWRHLPAPPLSARPSGTLGPVGGLARWSRPGEAKTQRRPRRWCGEGKTRGRWTSLWAYAESLWLPLAQSVLGCLSQGRPVVREAARVGRVIWRSFAVAP